jgi:OmpA-OmpF porin, OOP family
MKRAQTYLIASIVGGLLLSSLIAARGQDTRFYFKADLGGTISEDLKVKEFLGADVTGAKAKLEPGFRGGLGGGYQFTDWVAAELELGFMWNEISSITGASRVRDASFGNVPFLLNAKFQWPTKCPFSPYAGAGVGFSEAIFDVDRITINDVTISGSDSDTVFAWQAFAGIRYALNERMGLSVEYRYFEAGSPSWQADFTFGTGSDVFSLGRTRTHAISLAFDFRF